MIATCSLCALILTIRLSEWLWFFFILSDISNHPNPIVNWYDYLTSRLHVVYETDLQGTPSMRKTLDGLEFPSLQMLPVKFLQNLTVQFNFDVFEWEQQLDK